MYWYISNMAAWFAPPPIQLPASVESPLHTASKSAPPTVSGENIEINKIAKGPPIIMPIVTVKNMINAVEPRLKTAFKSILYVNNTNEAGKK